MLVWNEFFPNYSMISYKCNNLRIHLPENSDGAVSLHNISNYILSTDCNKIISSAYTDYSPKIP